MFQLFSNIVKNIEVDVFFRTSPKNDIVKNWETSHRQKHRIVKKSEHRPPLAAAAAATSSRAEGRSTLHSRANDRRVGEREKMERKVFPRLHRDLECPSRRVEKLLRLSLLCIERLRKILKGQYFVNTSIVCGILCCQELIENRKQCCFETISPQHPIY